MYYPSEQWEVVERHQRHKWYLRILQRKREDNQLWSTLKRHANDIHECIEMEKLLLNDEVVEFHSYSKIKKSCKYLKIISFKIILWRIDEVFNVQQDFYTILTHFKHLCLNNIDIIVSQSTLLTFVILCVLIRIENLLDIF
jgi:hypothetical protein